MPVSKFTLDEIYYYPLKSARGIKTNSVMIGRMGILYDRQWMVVDKDGMFVAQRADGKKGIGIRRMCLIRPSIEAGMLTLEAPGMYKLYLPLQFRGLPRNRTQVTIWDFVCEDAQDQGVEANNWISKFLSVERPGSYRIVRMPDDFVRPTNRGNGELAFADGYPFLMVSRASLDDLNARMGRTLPVDRFRPNFVLGGCNPYDEDKMGRIQIGNILFDWAKLCVRCPITTYDQQKIERTREPLKTLATYRKGPKGVTFCTNFNHQGNGIVSVGDIGTVIAATE